MNGEQRDRWQSAREARALVPGRDGFASAGLMGQLDEPVLFVTTLPGEPRRPLLAFDDDELINSVLPANSRGLMAPGLSMLHLVTSTSDALVRFANSGAYGSPWRGFIALRRDGGVELGFGSVVRRRFGQESTLAGVMAYRLFVLTHAIRLVVESQARLVARIGDDQLAPYEVNVALPGAGGALLDGFADGWRRAEHDFDLDATCLEENPLVRAEVEQWPMDVDGQEALIVNVARRVCDAFGVREPRFLARRGPHEGRLSPEYA